MVDSERVTPISYQKSNVTFCLSRTVLSYMRFCETGNDVNAVLASRWRPRLKKDGGFWKSDPSFLLVVNCNFLCIVHRFRVILMFLLQWDFPISGQILGVFRPPQPQVWKSINETPQRHFLSSNHAFWAIVRQHTSIGATCGRVDETNEKKGSILASMSPLPEGTFPLLELYHFLHT